MKRVVPSVTSATWGFKIRWTVTVADAVEPGGPVEVFGGEFSVPSWKPEFGVPVKTGVLPGISSNLILLPTTSLSKDS